MRRNEPEHRRPVRPTVHTSSRGDDARMRAVVDRVNEQPDDFETVEHEVEIERREVKPTTSTSSTGERWRAAADRVEEREAEDVDQMGPRELAKRFGRRH